MSTACLNASLKTWTALSGCFIGDHVFEMFAFINQARLQLGDVMNLAEVHMFLQLPAPSDPVV